MRLFSIYVLTLQYESVCIDAGYNMNAFFMHVVNKDARTTYDEG